MKIIKKLKDQWIKRLSRSSLTIDCEVREMDRLWKGSILNLSLSGAKIQVDRAFEQHSRVTLYLKKDFYILPLGAEIVRPSQKKESLYIAVRFVDLDPDTARELAHIMEGRREQD